MSMHLPANAPLLPSAWARVPHHTRRASWKDHPMTELLQDQAELAWQDPAILAEGLHWDGERQALWWVDIHGQRLLRWALDPAQPPQQWQLPERLGWVLPCQGSDAVLLGLQSGVACALLPEPAAPPPEPGDPSADATSHLADPFNAVHAPIPLAVDPAQLHWVARPFGQHPSLRLNDAKADASGAVWFGSLNNSDESRPDGVLYRLSPDGQCSAQDSGYQVTNGPAIDPFGRWMLHTDSGQRTIYRFELDVPSGHLGRRSVWKTFSLAEGYPDGMCFDAEGCVWIAHWGAGCVSRFAPDGRLLRRIWVPAEHVSNVCFGGPLLDRLFITTARAGLGAPALARQPLAGSLFELPHPGVRGLPACAAALPPGVPAGWAPAELGLLG